MEDRFKALNTWLSFTGFVMAVGILYWAQVVLVPVAMAALITFMLAGPVTRLQRRIGRVPAVGLVVAVVFAGLTAATWVLSRELTSLVADLPAYRANIREKAADVRRASRGGSVGEVQKTLTDIQQEFQQDQGTRGSAATPLVVSSEQQASLWGFPSWLGPAMGPLATGGLVITMVIFMLLEREDLRGRIISVVGHGHLAVTTRAFEEAGARVSRQLLMQALVNAIYGIGVGVGLWLIGVPYFVLWGALAAALRFIPYVGPLIAAVAPFAVALAALPGWTRPIYVALLFVGLELVTNLVLETVLYAGAAGVSQVGLLVSVAFWTWLWGPMGLLLATPLTVCVVVLGKYVSGLEFLATLMSDQPTMTIDQRYYQRLLARDIVEAGDILEQSGTAESRDQVFDAVMVPALVYAERDRLEERVSAEEEQDVVEATRELLGDLGGSEPVSLTEQAAAGDARIVIGVPVNGAADEVALLMLSTLIAPVGIAMTVLSPRVLASEVVERLRSTPGSILCLGDLRPSPPTRARYLVKKFRSALPDLPIVVGRWAPPDLADLDLGPLLEAGATRVASTLVETRRHVTELAAVTVRNHDAA
ncbi:Transport of quorum-sensing signal protein [Luteitalea pratensis]|uniref:Transport of quorum-sensing signal protein n=1 Tax=Luteitalea pratensis TaxID=1855912 RepID=A0A143PKP5_LUTPR|nr:AI-2E family transporter [Luteitalea pratensis]AMY09071.1 Transport of quorum-sensing signal protein [Luteitalea pratensis]